jgi:hypothetical protein
MMVCTVRTSVLRQHQDFYLSPSVYEHLRSFAITAPRRLPHPLIVYGPVKSSKTAVLWEVLPAIISREHRAGYISHKPRLNSMAD